MTADNPKTDASERDDRGRVPDGVGGHGSGGSDTVDDTGREIFSVVITPHRSLSRRGFLIFMGVVGGIGFIAGLVFMAMGAWPVFGFFGLDVLLIYLAFRANYRSARAREFVRITESELLVRRVSPRGAVAEWRFNPVWVRLKIDRDHEGELQRVSLVSRGRILEIADWLSPPEKTDFLHALAAALATARRGLPA